MHSLTELPILLLFKNYKIFLLKHFLRITGFLSPVTAISLPCSDRNFRLHLFDNCLQVLANNSEYRIGYNAIVVYVLKNKVDKLKRKLFMAPLNNKNFRSRLVHKT